MLAPLGQTRAPRVSRAAHREPRQSCSSVARQSRTGLLDEVDGVPFALDRARLVLSGCRNSNLDDILTSVLLAHPARALEVKAPTCWKLAAEMSCLIGRSRSRSRRPVLFSRRRADAARIR